MTIWAIRHPEVAAEGLCYGRLDVPLFSPTDALQRISSLYPTWASEWGVGQCSVRLRTSPLSRCTFVAHALAERLGTEPLVDPDLCELDMGAFEGKSYCELESSLAFIRYMRNWRLGRPPQGERIGELEARVGRAWARASRAESAGSAWVEVWCTHAGVIRALQVITQGKSWREVLAQPVPCLVPFCFRPADGPAVERWDKEQPSGRRSSRPPVRASDDE